MVGTPSRERLLFTPSVEWRRFPSMSLEARAPVNFSFSRERGMTRRLLSSRVATQRSGTRCWRNTEVNEADSTTYDRTYGSPLTRIGVETVITGFPAPLPTRN